jgi:hypothetical protein
MFNHTWLTNRFNNYKILGGAYVGDYQSHKTLFAGNFIALGFKILYRT